MKNIKCDVCTRIGRTNESYQFRVYELNIKYNETERIGTERFRDVN